MTRLVFPRVEHPRVSVIMVTYGRWDWVSRSLPALLKHTPPIYELIVVDNASPDGTGARLEEALENARGVRIATNLGFGTGANVGALLAGGAYLGLLNSDALVQPGWVEPLIARLDRDREAAAVVPRLVGLDGKLQEAGRLIGADGSTVGYGQGDDPDAPEYSFARELDYGSAACMLVRRSAFERAGGFDPMYPVGYCEDVDLCFRFADLGLRTLYEPASAIVHAGGASSTPWEAERLVGLNTRILAARWGRRLQGRPSLAGGGVPRRRLIAARDSRIRDRILVLGDEVPDDGDLVGILLGNLLGEWPRARTTLLAAAGKADDTTARIWLDRGVEVACDPPDDEAWFQERLLHASVVVVCGARAAARFGDHAAWTQPQAAFVYVPVRQESDDPHATSLRRAELSAIRRADSVLCSTEAERRFVLAAAPGIPCVARSPEPRALVRAMAHAGMATPTRIPS